MRLYQPTRGNRTAKGKFDDLLSPWSFAAHYHGDRLDGLPVPKVVADAAPIANAPKWVLGFFSIEAVELLCLFPASEAERGAVTVESNVVEEGMLPRVVEPAPRCQLSVASTWIWPELITLNPSRKSAGAWELGIPEFFLRPSPRVRRNHAWYGDSENGVLHEEAALDRTFFHLFYDHTPTLVYVVDHFERLVSNRPPFINLAKGLSWSERHRLLSNRRLDDEEQVLSPDEWLLDGV